MDGFTLSCPGGSTVLSHRGRRWCDPRWLTRGAEGVAPAKGHRGSFWEGGCFTAHLLHLSFGAVGTTDRSRRLVVRLNPSAVPIESAKLSPTVVHRILIAQNHAVTSGTLLSITRMVVVSALVASVTGHVANRPTRQWADRRG